MNNLINCLNAIKTAQNNKIKDFKIDEDLKFETRKDYKSTNPFKILFLMVITYVLSLYSIIAYTIIIYVGYAYITKHPGFKMFILRWQHGATRNQLNVIYYQVFSHIPKLRYVLILPTFLLFISILNYTPLYPQSLQINHILFLDSVNFLQSANANVKILVDNLHNNKIKDFVIFMWAFSESRAVSAYLNTLIIAYFAIMSTIQIFKRPQNVG